MNMSNMFSCLLNSNTDKQLAPQSESITEDGKGKTKRELNLLSVTHQSANKVHRPD